MQKPQPYGKNDLSYPIILSLSTNELGGFGGIKTLAAQRARVACNWLLDDDGG